MSKLLDNIIKIFFAAAIGIILFANIQIFVFGGLKKLVLFVILSAILMVFGYFIYKKKYYKTALEIIDKNYNFAFLCILFVCLIVRVVYVNVFVFDVKGDPLTVLNAATDFLNGNISFKDDSYFSIWKFQLPLVVYEAYILKLFGTIKVFYYLNILFSVLSGVLIWKIVMNITHDNMAAIIVFGFYSIFPESISHTGMIYNHVPSGLMVLLFLLIFTSEKTFSGDNIYKTALLTFVAGIMLGIGNLFRSECVIYLTAGICFIIYKIICVLTDDEKEKLKKVMLNCCIAVSFVVGYYMVTYLAKRIIFTLGLGSDIGNKCPFWQILCGLNPENNGTYTGSYSYIVSIKGTPEQLEEFKKILATIYADMGVIDIVKFFNAKMYAMWGGYDTLYFMNQDYINSLLYSVIIVMSKIFYIVLNAVSLATIFKTGKDNKMVNLVQISFIGMFLIHVLKEAAARYRYSATLVTFVLFAVAIHFFMEKRKSI